MTSINLDLAGKRIFCPEVRGEVGRVRFLETETVGERVPKWIGLDECQEATCPFRKKCRPWIKWQRELLRPILSRE
jgi:hypothetical protein